MNNWFQESDLLPRSHVMLQSAPPTPETGWRPDTSFPDITDAAAIGFDAEVKEWDWDNGPGWARGKSQTVGYSITAWAHNGYNRSWYYPIRHEVEPEYNLEPKKVIDYVRTCLQTPHIPKFGANLPYDIGTATNDGIFVCGELHDVCYGESLLAEADEVNLDALGVKYLDRGKESNRMYDWIRAAYGSAGDPRKHIWRTSPRLVGPYAEEDSRLPFEVYQKQQPKLWSEGLWTVYRMECDSIPMLVQMRLPGVTVDLDKAQQFADWLLPEQDRLQTLLYEESGLWVNVSSPGDLEHLFTKLGIPFNRTAKGNASFTKDFLKSVNHPVGNLIQETRKVVKIREMVVSQILSANINGKVYPQFNSLRSDEYGTRSGRYSCSTPNLQQVPARSKMGQHMRSMFVPDSGHCCWEAGDYSQIEYRMLAHFAVGPGSDELRSAYNSDPTIDYHKRTQQMVKEVANVYIPRKPGECNAETGNNTIKEYNFGFVFGMGERKLIRQSGLSEAKAKLVMEAYHKGNPYVRPTMKEYADFADLHGYIATILGRRSRFDLWEPAGIPYEERQNYPSLELGPALGRYGRNIRRSKLHKALNRLLQGSAADLLKAAMLQCYQAGIYYVTGFPRLTVHDENSHSVIDESPQQNEAYAEMHHIFETAIPIKVPIRFDVARGKNWEECKD